MEAMVVNKARVILWMLGVLVACLVLGLFAGRQQVVRNEALINQALFSEGKVIEHELISRLDMYTYRLRSIRGAIYMLQLPNVTRELMHRFSQVRDIEKEFPGARGFGFVRRVPLDEEAAFLKRVRAEGRPDFMLSQMVPHKGERFVIE